MKKGISYLIYIIIVWTPFIDVLSQSPVTSSPDRPDYYDSLLTELTQSYLPSAIDINRMPINICFIKNKEKYVGFVIAGHALKDVCRVASLGVRNFLDSLGYGPNTISSFGVGFDLRNSNWSAAYNNRMLELEKIFLDLQNKDLLQVHVSYVSYAVFEAMRGKITDNVRIAENAIKSSNSINRIVFNYSRVNYPLPVAFYIDDSIIKFKIAKNKIGAIPKVKQFEDNLLDKALIEVEKSISTNDRALTRLASYNPVTYTADLTELPFPIIYNNGLKDYTTKYLLQFDTTKMVKEYERLTKRLRRYYSLTELRTMCNRGETYLTLKNRDGRQVNTCAQIDWATKTIRNMNSYRNEIETMILKLNKTLTYDKYRLLEIKKQYLLNKSKNDNTIVIDAFLRGWPFDSDDKSLNAKLEKWYDKRQGIWAEIMAKNPEYKNRLKAKKELIKNENNIAGIFQFDDVFFSVSDAGAEYIVTPYRLLSGDFVQVVDRTNKISQFFSVNNFRLIQL